MANEQNIIPHQFTSDQSREAAAKNGAKGGIAAGASRRRAKSMRQWAKALAKEGMRITTPEGKEIEGDIAGGIVIAQMRKAAKGDTKAAKFVADLLGELVEQQAQGGVTINVNAQTKDDADNIAAILNGGKK
jgi:hypothetical protein